MPFLPISSKSEERPSPQIPRESEGTRNRKERQDFIPSAPQGQRNKTRESEKTLVCRRKSQAIFDGRHRVPRKFMEFSGDRVPSDFKEIGGNKASLPFFKILFPLPRRGRGIKHANGRKRSSPVENRLRFSTRDGGSPPISKESEGTLLCRRKSLAIFDGRGRVPRKFIEFSGDNEKKDRRSFFLKKKDLR